MLRWDPQWGLCSSGIDPAPNDRYRTGCRRLTFLCKCYRKELEKVENNILLRVKDSGSEVVVWSCEGKVCESSWAGRAAYKTKAESIRLLFEIIELWNFA
jgi:hypothetical protein